MRFAARTDFGAAPSGYAAALEQARARDGFLDLTVSNPTRCGFLLSQGLLQPLAHADALLYTPDPLGLHAAREAVAGRYRERHGADILPEQILLTASTSESYSYLLRLFCEPGDAILVPTPSYPLFDLLARLHDVELLTYPLVYHDGWQIDPVFLQGAVTARTRAIVVIHPNNPTGHFCSPEDRDVLLQCAAEHGLPLIVDEVFLEYGVESSSPPSFAAGSSTAFKSFTRRAPSVLTFVLGGLSKLLCLPQMKLAWTLVLGPADEAVAAIERLEVIADTFLSVAAPPQIALPMWLQEADAVRRPVAERVRQNLAWLDTVLAGSAVSRLRVEAGWAVVLRIPALEADVTLVIRLLHEHGVAAHPGSFYGFAPSGWLVVSLIVQPWVFQQGLDRLFQALSAQDRSAIDRQHPSAAR